MLFFKQSSLQKYCETLVLSARKSQASLQCCIEHLIKEPTVVIAASFLHALETLKDEPIVDTLVFHLSTIPKEALLYLYNVKEHKVPQLLTTLFNERQDTHARKNIIIALMRLNLAALSHEIQKNDASVSKDNAASFLLKSKTKLEEALSSLERENNAFKSSQLIVTALIMIHQMTLHLSKSWMDSSLLDTDENVGHNF